MTKHIYIHFPYCLYKCHYCDFNSYAWKPEQIPHQSYFEALKQEVSVRQNQNTAKTPWYFSKNDIISSVFFGGGTPSLMESDHVKALLDLLFKDLTPASDIEVTLEANPGTLTLPRLKSFQSAGINRLSMGIQSFQEKNLTRFGRIHDGQQAKESLSLALEAGFEKVSADMIYGFPDQSFQEWQQDLEDLLKFPLRHFSCYALTAEEGTSYTSALQSGAYQETPSDLMAQMADWTYQRAKDQGLPAYEVSNFAQIGHESQHNLGYWNYQDFLGLGAGAWGQMAIGHGTSRAMNLKDPAAYSQSMSQQQLPEPEKITSKMAQGEFMMMGLRLKKGILVSDFEGRFGQKMGLSYPQALKIAQDRGLLEQTKLCVRPTEKGFAFNNQLVQLFL